MFDHKRITRKGGLWASEYPGSADTYVHVDESAKRAMIDSISQNFRFL